MTHEYKTEGSDRKHGALRMVSMCSCGWSGKVIDGQGPDSQAFAKWQWESHMADVDMAQQIQQEALNDSERQRGVKL